MSRLGLWSLICQEHQLVLDITLEACTDGCHHYHHSVRLLGILFSAVLGFQSMQMMLSLQVS